MNPYLAILSSRFRTLLQYRAAAIAGIGTQLFFGLVRMMIYDGFYSSSTTTQPMTHDQVLTYIWLGQALLLLTLLAVDRDVADMIRTGNVVYEMIRPLDLYSYWYARAFSGRAAPLLMRSGPILIVAGLFLSLQAPVSMVAGTLFLLSAFLGLLLAASLVALITISMLWTISGEGVSRLVPPLIFFFSGIIIPLPFFPEWLQPLLDFLPFRGLIDTPFRLYLGHLGGAAAIAAVVHQVLWLSVFVIAGRWILSRGLGRLVVQGG